MLAEFRCDNGPDGVIVECQETFDRFLTASNWVCNSNWALQDRIIRSFFQNIIFLNRSTTLYLFRATRILALEIIRSTAEQNLLILKLCLPTKSLIIMKSKTGGTNIKRILR